MKVLTGDCNLNVNKRGGRILMSIRTKHIWPAHLQIDFDEHIAKELAEDLGVDVNLLNDNLRHHKISVVIE